MNNTAFMAWFPRMIFPILWPLAYYYYLSFLPSIYSLLGNDYRTEAFAFAKGASLLIGIPLCYLVNVLVVYPYLKSLKDKRKGTIASVILLPISFILVFLLLLAFGLNVIFEPFTLADFLEDVFYLFLHIFPPLVIGFLGLWILFRLTYEKSISG